MRYTPINQRRIKMTCGDSVVELKPGTITANHIEAIGTLPPAATVQIDLLLSDRVQRLGQVQAQKVQTMSADAVYATHELSMYFAALFAGVHPDAALLVCEFAGSGGGYVCTNCGDIDHIEVTFQSQCLLVQSKDGTLEGTDDSALNNDKEFSAASPATCTACSFSGSLSEFDASAPDTLIKTRLGMQQQGYVGRIAGAELRKTRTEDTALAVTTA